MSDQLKPCMYCSRDAKLITIHELAWVECLNCKASSPRYTCNRADEVAVRIWNEFSTNYEFKEVVTEEVLGKVFDRVDKRLSRLNEYDGLNEATLAKVKAQADCLRELIAVLTFDFSSESESEPEPVPDNVRYLPVRNKR